MWEGVFALAEEEELASVASDRTLRLKHLELELCVFWMLVEQQYLAIAQKAQRLLVQFSTSFLCKFEFSAMTTIKHNKGERLLSVEEEFQMGLSKTRPRVQTLCRNLQIHVLH